MEHPQRTTSYLWNSGIHFHDAGKPLLDQNVRIRVSRFLSKNYSFLTYRRAYNRTKATKVISSCTSKLFSLNNSNSSSKEPSSSSSQKYSLDAIATIIFVIRWDFLISYQISLSPPLKRCAIITHNYGIYKLPHELPNDLELRILAN